MQINWNLDEECNYIIDLENKIFEIEEPSNRFGVMKRKKLNWSKMLPKIREIVELQLEDNIMKIDRAKETVYMCEKHNKMEGLESLQKNVVRFHNEIKLMKKFLKSEKV